MRIRYKNNHSTTGFANEFNTYGMGEVIVYFDEGDATSEYIRELEVEVNGEWIDMKQAFRDKILMSDNYDVRFGIPTDKDRERGYML